jgi:AraC family transcriptional activator FtrA
MAPFELSVVIEVFGLDRPELGIPGWYTLDVFTTRPGLLPAVGGVAIQVSSGLDAVGRADTVIVPGWRIADPVPVELINALRGAHERGARIVSICSGAFVLAATGLLDGRRAATHWQYAGRLAERYPAVDVDPAVLFIDHGDVLTSAGSAAGIDLCLHLIRRDHGAAVANHVARRLVVPPVRDGGQAQYVENPVAHEDDDRIHDVIGWLTADLRRPVTLSVLAARANLSERQFARRFRGVTGTSPIDWIINRRVHASLPLLETGDDSVEQVGTAVGFPSAVIFRKHFRAKMRTTPTAYRRAFRRP